MKSTTVGIGKDEGWRVATHQTLTPKGELSRGAIEVKDESYDPPAEEAQQNCKAAKQTADRHNARDRARCGVCRTQVQDKPGWEDVRAGMQGAKGR